jgi:Sigma-70, region 4
MPFSQDPPDNWFTGDAGFEGALQIAQMSLRHLRAAIQNDEISFPSQVPVFACQSRADIQWRLVELYFVHNWSCSDLGERYGVTMERARQLISQWVRRAAVLGYLQEIPAEAPEVARPGVSDLPSVSVAAAILGQELEADSLMLTASR